jgi:hypothetical protein
MKRTLNVKKTDIVEVESHWGFYPTIHGRPVGVQSIYVRCNVKGSVNWDKAPIYTACELLKRGNVNLID